MLAILAPGQGAQTPGQLKPWLEIGGVESRLRWWSAAVGIDLVDVGRDGSAETIRDTAVAQPLIVATGLVAAEQLSLPRTGNLLVAGHSVGEITASVLAGALDAESALVFVALRGRAMAEAAGRVPTGMTAVVGGDPDEVTEHLRRLDLTAANRNGAGQIVAAGSLEALARLAEEPPPRARLRPLSVAGAFHTHFMQPASDQLAGVAPGLRPRTPVVAQLSNADGNVIDNGPELVQHLADQVAAPVRWDLCLARMRDLGVTAIVELPPAGTLAGIAKRELTGVQILAVKTPDDLPAARELIAHHTDAPSGDDPDGGGDPAAGSSTAAGLVGATR
ncbi:MULTISPECIES: ACP S-malonyltransferase [Protofrankia]|uniref:[acyl-carrier-protein] S-malonyltransferase n=1 Tax=Candidatus Protofrankia datiscae TaxID=2716812 RepID=F8B2G6_9ACTN|nr:MULTISPECIES: ACP S-malonyltransferase [Protofrankia]AEH10847.1 (Acyl-carrier-protein) S-malonyltransferase [Candidatus Protofrankia datiscae]